MGNIRAGDAPFPSGAVDEPCCGDHLAPASPWYENRSRIDVWQQRMMRIRNISRRVLGRAPAGALAAVALVVALAGASRAGAVTPEQAAAAFRSLDEWVRAWEIPEDAPVELGEDASGVAVTFRFGGKVIGRGAVMRGDAAALSEAARRAWIEANQRLPVERDAMRQRRLREASRAVRISLEIAGPLTPLFGDSVQQAGRDVSPGREGVAARAGDSMAAIFPDFALTAGMLPPSALRAALSDADLPALTPLGRLRRERGVIVYRFETQHLAQVSPESAPIFLTRGGRVRSMADVSPAGIRSLGDEITTHLLRRRWPGEEPLGLTGVYLPTQGEYASPIVADARAQAMAAYALAKWSEARKSDRAREAAVEILRDLSNVHESETGPGEDPPAAAATLLALRALGGAAELGFDAEVFAESMRASALRAYDESEGFDADLSPAERALVAAGLAAEPSLREPARIATRRLFRETPPPALPGLMPWLGWAELSLRAPGEAIPASVALLDFRSLVWRHQLTEAMLDPRDADLAGGIVFTAGGAALPTDQTLRPVAFIATMLGSPSLTNEQELAPEFARLVASLRFVAQLTAGEAEAHMYADPRRAIGGVRTALWDQRMPLESSAMALLTLSETLASLEKRTGRDAGANNPADPPG